MSDDRQLEFVDTNILVYAHDVSAGKKHIIAQQLIRQLWDSGDGCISIQVLQEWYVTVTKKITQPLAPERATEIIRDLSFWHIHIPSANDVLGAIDLQLHEKISFWDAMVIHSAIKLDCKVVWSEDLSHNQIYNCVTVKNPFASNKA